MVPRLVLAGRELAPHVGICSSAGAGWAAGPAGGDAGEEGCPRVPQPAGAAASGRGRASQRGRKVQSQGS